MNANGRYTIGYCRPLLTHTVMICTAAASLSRRRLRSARPATFGASAVRSQVPQRGQPETLAVRGVLQQLGDVRQVGHQPFPALPGQHPPCPYPASCAASNTAATPRSRACPAQLRSFSATRSVSESPPAARISAVSRKNIVDAAARTRPGRCGCSNASSRHSQSCAAAESEHVGIPGVHARDTGLGERGVAGPGVLVGLDDDRDIAGLQRLAGEGGAAGQQRADIGGQVACRCVHAGRSIADGRGCSCVPRVTPPATGTARCAVRPGQPVALVMALTLVHDDAGAAQLRAAQHHLQPVHQRGVAAPVDAQGLLVPGGLGGPQVGVDVAAAERVDGLLRVADQDQRRPPGERPLDDLPLHRVGVLELVDHHDRPALRHPHPGRRIVGSASASASRVSRSS